jgi:hypothetical protein
MKMSSVWRQNKSTTKRKRPIHKPKICWDSLGLPSTPHASVASIEEIRRQVTSLASRGFGQGTRSRSEVKEPQGGSRRRRGATE